MMAKRKGRKRAVNLYREANGRASRALVKHSRYEVPVMSRDVIIGRMREAMKLDARPKIFDDSIHEYQFYCPLWSAIPGVHDTSIYVIVAEDGPLKIGISSDPGRRLVDLQTGQDRLLNVYWAVRLVREDAAIIEARIHKKWKDTINHTRGEWYYIDPDLTVEAIKREISKSFLHSVPDIHYGILRGADFDRQYISEIS